MQAAVVVTWTKPVTGREARALEYGDQVNKFWAEQAKQGKCSQPELFFSEHGTGMWMVKGDRDALLQIHDTEESKMFLLQGDLLFENYSVDVCYTGDSAADYMAHYARALQAIG